MYYNLESKYMQQKKETIYVSFDIIFFQELFSNLLFIKDSSK